MTRRRRTAAIALLGALAALVLPPVLAAREARAHGSMQNPASRAYACWQEGPEHPRSAACQAAVATGGTQPLYDWNEINLPSAAGRHRELIPDGRLCSAGRDKYRGLDLARADWPATALPPGGSYTYTFTFRATAPHRGTFELYVTRDGYDPARPLAWSDLEPAPFLTATDPPLVGGSYVMTGELPRGKQGRHLIYTIWQRSDSPEAFYACSDVTFGSAPPTTAPPATAPPTTAPPAAGPHPAWQPGIAYATGDRVSYGGAAYQCRQAHTSLPGWEPPAVPALWQPLP